MGVGGWLLMGRQGERPHQKVITATANERMLCARPCPLCALILQLQQLWPRDAQRAEPGWELGTRGYLLSCFLVLGP